MEQGQMGQRPLDDKEHMDFYEAQQKARIPKRIKYLIEVEFDMQHHLGHLLEETIEDAISRQPSIELISIKEVE